MHNSLQLPLFITTDAQQAADMAVSSPASF